MQSVQRQDEISILLPDSGQRVQQRRFVRRWNQLSRLQRTLVYIMVILLLAIGGVLYVEKTLSTIESDNVTKESQEAVSQTVSANLVNDLLNINSNVELDTASPRLFTGPTNERQQAVVNSFRHAWNGYKKYAWGHDNLRPIAGMGSDWFSLGLTIVDSLDTAYIMGLNEEYEEGKNWIANDLTFTRNKDVNFFEVTIRVLGALLTNYHFTLDDMFLQKAIDLGDRLMGAFSSPSGIPYSDVNLATKRAHAPEWSLYSSTAEVSTVQLEFRELSRASKNPIFEETAYRVSEKIHHLPKKHGLVPIFINPGNGNFLSYATITLGARGDSYYEYLLKQWIQTGKTRNHLLEDYLLAIEGVRDLLAKRTSVNKYLFIGELSSGSEAFIPKMDHLTCFLPGTLALGVMNGLPDWHMKMAEELLYTCYLTYAVHPTFLAPEITHFNLASSSADTYTKAADSHNLLRPEFVESLWYMYQITGNTTYQEWGWKIFQAFEKHARVENGYSSLNNVRVENAYPRDMMESFFLSETLKYLYLLFSDDRYVIDLKKYVINTEAHPFPIYHS